MNTLSAVSQLDINSLSLSLSDPSKFFPITMEGVPRLSERIVTFLNSMISFVVPQPTAVNFEACYEMSNKPHHLLLLLRLTWAI